MKWPNSTYVELLNSNINWMDLKQPPKPCGQLHIVAKYFSDKSPHSTKIIWYKIKIQNKN